MVFLDLSHNLVIGFQISFFILKRTSRATNQKKVCRNIMTGSQDNAFNWFLKFPPILYSNFLYFSGGSRINNVLVFSNIKFYTVYCFIYFSICYGYNKIIIIVVM